MAAFPSLSADQLMSDPHLLPRDAFPTGEHPDKGRQRAVAPPWRFSETPARVDRWTPDLPSPICQRTAASRMENCART
ncbi:MAG: hypothetical protein ACRERE_35035 [Candidatus Entotheonellia bacterium]